jgi:peptidoglycan/xylan/chitin deacetylase (PgdA/CDA1 family)
MMIGVGKMQLKRAVVSVLGSELALGVKLVSIARSDALTILNLHRVDDAHTSTGGAMSPALFEELINWLKPRFRIVTFAELISLPGNGKPPLILSFDDGYKDFIDTVAPILDKHGLRANQNVIPGCVESRLPPMNVVLRDFIAQAPASLLREIPLPGLPLGADSERRASSSQRASANLKGKPIAEQKAIFAELQPNIARFDGFTPTPLMTVADIIEVGAVHEIGTHSSTMRRWLPRRTTMSQRTPLVAVTGTARSSEPRLWFMPFRMAAPGRAKPTLCAPRAMTMCSLRATNSPRAARRPILE